MANLIFDVNGTLTEHRKPISHSTRMFIETLAKYHTVILTSGVEYAAIKEKLQTTCAKVHAVYGSAGNEKYVKDKIVYSKRVHFSTIEAEWIDNIINGDVRIEPHRMVLTNVESKEETCDKIEEKYSHLSCCINTSGDEIHVLRKDCDKTQIVYEYAGAMFFTDNPNKYSYDYTLAQRLVTRKVDGPSDLPQLCRDLIKL